MYWKPAFRFMSRFIIQRTMMYVLGNHIDRGMSSDIDPTAVRTVLWNLRYDNKII